MKPPINKEQISIMHSTDVQYAANHAKYLSEQMGFGKAQSISISVVVSELANNIYKYAHTGNIVIEPIRSADKRGVQVTAEDYGPGIRNIMEALKDGYSSKGTMGLGLPGVNRLMDEFYFDDKRNIGTKIEVRKWI